tara:strand:- start:11207 stop:11671 length:465 start_codon:yes stop_codon:yes gene_type:complete
MKYISLIILFLSFSTIQAQSGFNHITYKGGLTYEGAFNGEIGYEINKRYYNNWSLFFSGYSQKIDSSETINNWTTGLYYEPNIIASKNNFLNLKFGSSLGTNESEFIIDLIVGLEYNYAFSENMKFTIYFKNNRMFNSDIQYRHAILIGFKHRL